MKVLTYPHRKYKSLINDMSQGADKVIKVQQELYVSELVEKRVDQKKLDLFVHKKQQQMTDGIDKRFSDDKRRIAEIKEKIQRSRYDGSVDADELMREIYEAGFIDPETGKLDFTRKTKNYAEAEIEFQQSLSDMQEYQNNLMQRQLQRKSDSLKEIKEAMEEFKD